ncbi:MAG: hypothetical protein B7Z83_03570 [Thiomonas sp. 20-64-5]|nr:MAG: hypothetical protein B7Z83_03570 [Thiomonas sp. 20-64-5]
MCVTAVTPSIAAAVIKAVPKPPCASRSTTSPIWKRRGEWAVALLDPSLRRKWREQAASLGVRRPSVPAAAPYASPMARIMETAQRVSVPHGPPVQTEAALREIDYGNWEGLRRRHRPLCAGLRSVGGRSASGGARLRRVGPERHPSGAALSVRDHRTTPHQTVLIVSHQGTNRLLVSSLLGPDARGNQGAPKKAPLR